MADFELTLDPERVYVNMSAAAAAATTQILPTPFASFQQRRFTPVISDLSKYKLAVVSCSLNGCRNFPVFVPQIDTTQSADPTLTIYQVGVSLTAVTSNGETSWPTTPTPFNFNVCIFDAVSGQGPWYSVGVNPGGSISALLASINTEMTTTAGLVGVPQIGAIVATTDVTGRIVFSLPGTTYPNTRFAITAGVSVAPYFTPGTPWTPAAVAYATNALGLPYAPTGSPASAYTLYSASDGNTPAGTFLTMPNEPYYTLPAVSLRGAASSNVFTGSATIQWRSQTGYTVPPIQNGIQAESPAYWMYDYEWFASLMNDALTTAFNAAVSAAAASGFSVSIATPFVDYNPSTKNFTLYSDASATPSNRKFSGTIPVGPLAGLAFTLNAPLADLLLFPASFDQNSGQATLSFSQAPVVVNPTGGASTAAVSYSALTPDYPCVATLWSPVISLVFQSKLMPVRTEVISAPISYGGTGVSAQSVATSYDSVQILTDVTPIVADGADWRTESTTFTPTVYRWVDLPSGAFPLNDLDFSLAWKNGRTGSITPIVLNSGANFTVKILFQRRDVF